MTRDGFRGARRRIQPHAERGRAAAILQSSEARTRTKAERDGIEASLRRLKAHPS